MYFLLFCVPLPFRAPERPQRGGWGPKAEAPSAFWSFSAYEKRRNAFTKNYFRTTRKRDYIVILGRVWYTVSNFNFNRKVTAGATFLLKEIEVAQYN